MTMMMMKLLQEYGQEEGIASDIQKCGGKSRQKMRITSIFRHLLGVSHPQLMEYIPLVEPPIPSEWLSMMLLVYRALYHWERLVCALCLN